MYDIIIIGGGPAGLTAAVYARRSNKSVLVIEKSTFGGQITYSPKVENIPGFLCVSGNEFAEKITEQALELDAEVEMAEVLSLSKDESGIFIIKTDDASYSSKAVIIASGARHRVLGLENENKYLGNGISFCAVCDGAFYRDKSVIVVGGGNSALQEALLLSDVAKSVTIVQNLPFLTGEAKLVDLVSSKKNIKVICNCIVKEYIGEDELNSISIKDNDTSKLEKLDCNGVFLAVGLEPQNEIFKDILNLNENGYILSDADCRTNVEGIFTAGDCRVKNIRQVVTAASDGAVAALSACKYLDR